MKRRVCTLMLAALLALLLLPAYAAGGQEDTGIAYIRDEAGILTDSEVTRLEVKAEEIAENYTFAVNILILQDYAPYGTSVFDAAMNLYENDGLGYGSGHDGVLLLLSMDGRDFANIAYGYGNTAFTDYGKEQMEPQFLDDFADNDWFDGCYDYLRVSEKYLSLAREGKPFDVGSQRTMGDILFMVGIRAGLPLLIAGIYILRLRSQMKSVAVAQDAGEYIDEDGVHLSEKSDIFTHTTRTQRKIERSSSGGGTSTNSRGFSGRSGKF